MGDTEAGRDARREAFRELFLQHGDELGAGEALVGLSWNAWLGGSAAEATNARRGNRAARAPSTGA